MAENDSVHDDEVRQKDSQNPPRNKIHRVRPVNVVRVDELERTIANLLKKALESLPPVVGAGVRPPVQGKKNLTSPLRDDRPSVNRGCT